MTKWRVPTARRTKFKTGLKPQSRFYKWNKITGPVFTCAESFIGPVPGRAWRRQRRQKGKKERAEATLLWDQTKEGETEERTELMRGERGRGGGVAVAVDKSYEASATINEDQLWK